MNNYNANQFNQYAQYPYQQYPYPQGPMPRQAPVGNTYTPHTNKRFVTSLEEAMSLHAFPNSEMVYFDQNQDLLYNIYTDGRGQKTSTVVELRLRSTPVNQELNLEERIKILESKMEELNGKYNGKSDATNATNVTE